MQNVTYVFNIYVQFNSTELFRFEFDEISYGSPLPDIFTLISTNMDINRIKILSKNLSKTILKNLKRKIVKSFIVLLFFITFFFRLRN